MLSWLPQNGASLRAARIPRPQPSHAARTNIRASSSSISLRSVFWMDCKYSPTASTPVSSARSSYGSNRRRCRICSAISAHSLQSQRIGSRSACTPRPTAWREQTWQMSYCGDGLCCIATPPRHSMKAGAISLDAVVGCFDSLRKCACVFAGLWLQRVDSI